MSYRYGHPFKQRDGWYYWGKHVGRVPDCPGPFESEAEALKHAKRHGWGRLQKTPVSKLSAMEGKDG